ncbi:MAG: hypothetical protein LBG21_00705 [Campylobacteraceae bacterium]|jgi:uncharacterized protein YcfL|nr:hypothetical protein [Campylobacteraceae bacterium]
MKRYVLPFIILSILILSGCSAKNNIQNNLHNNQTYYQDDNLTKYEQNIKLNKNNITLQRNIAKDIVGGLKFFIDMAILIDIIFY